MRAWKDSDPKAGLLARKQSAILAAARSQFLEKGFGETTMAGVAADAGVSVATLYRHTRSKEELFEAVVALRHDPEQLAAGIARIAAMPLREALAAFGEGVLAMLISPEIVAMHRIVIAEAERFPKLGAMVFSAVVGHVTTTLTAFLTSRIGGERAAAIAPAFIERLMGDQLLRALLAMPSEAPEARRARIAAMIDDLVPEARTPGPSSK